MKNDINRNDHRQRDCDCRCRCHDSAMRRGAVYSVLVAKGVARHPAIQALCILILFYRASWMKGGLAKSHSATRGGGAHIYLPCTIYEHIVCRHLVNVKSRSWHDGCRSILQCRCSAGRAVTTIEERRQNENRCWMALDRKRTGKEGAAAAVDCRRPLPCRHLLVPFHPNNDPRPLTRHTVPKYPQWQRTCSCSRCPLGQYSI